MADKLAVRTEDVDFEAGVFWFHHDLENRGFFSPDFREGIEQFYSDNYGGNVNFVSSHELFGLRNMLTIGLSPQYEDEPTQNYENIFGHPGATNAPRHRQFSKRSSLSRRPVVSHTAVIDPHRSAGDFRGASFR